MRLRTRWGEQMVIALGPVAMRQGSKKEGFRGEKGHGRQGIGVFRVQKQTLLFPS